MWALTFIQLTRKHIWLVTAGLPPGGAFLKSLKHLDPYLLDQGLCFCFFFCCFFFTNQVALVLLCSKSNWANGDHGKHRSTCKCISSPDTTAQLEWAESRQGGSKCWMPAGGGKIVKEQNKQQPQKKNQAVTQKAGFHFTIMSLSSGDWVLMMVRITGRFATKGRRSPRWKTFSCHNAALNSKSRARGWIFWFPPPQPPPLSVGEKCHAALGRLICCTERCQSRNGW